MADKKDDKKQKLSIIEKRLVKSSVDIQRNEPEDITYQHTVFCQTGMPYRNPGDNVRTWERKQGRATLLINAGSVINPDTEHFVEVGLPFGPKPRLILTHLNSQALKNGSPVIEVQSSLTAFVRSIGLSCSGRDIRAIKDHLSRLSASYINLGYVQDKRAVQINTQIVKAFDLWFDKHPGQRFLWPSTVQLSDDYFQSLMSHAVPLDMRAVASLSHSAMGLDIYAWLAQRLHRVPKNKTQFIPWTALKDQFGFHYGRMDNFKAVFRKTLHIVRSQYQIADIDLDNRGMMLYNSPPPITPRTMISVSKK